MICGEAPSLVIIDKLLKEGAEVVAYDPVAMDECRRILGDAIKYASEKHEALIDADALVLVTEWAEFRVLNYRMLNKLMKNQVIFDGRNIFDASEIVEHGFSYFSIGRKPIINESK